MGCQSIFSDLGAKETMVLPVRQRRKILIAIHNHK